jgi:hypothetical protein
VRSLVSLLFGLVLALSPAGATGATSKPAALQSVRFVASGASQALSRGGVKLRYQQTQADDPVARVTFYVPKGYQLATERPVGTQLGTAAVTLFVADRNETVPVAGIVELVGATESATQSPSCTGKATEGEVWAFRLALYGVPFAIPAYVEPITSGPLASFAAAQIVLCLPPGDVPPGTPGRAPHGAKVLLTEFTTSSIANPATAGAFRWRATVVPYSPGTGDAHTAAMVELQSIVALASTVTLRARARKARKPGFQTVTYGGALVANKRGVADAVVEVFRGGTAQGFRKFKSQTTSASGSFTGSFAAKQAPRAGSVFLLARANSPEQDLGAPACEPTFVIPCQRATVGGFSVSSDLVRVAIPAAPKTKKR